MENIIYDIQIKILDPSLSQFEGHVKLKARTNEKQIILNCKNIIVTKCNYEFDYKSSNNTGIGYGFGNSVGYEDMIINIDGFEKDITIEIEYIGFINGISNDGLLDRSGSSFISDKIGLFRDYNNSEYVLATYTEPIYTRYIFPCFDEPSFKAVFNLSLVIPNDMVGLSNTKIIDNVLYKSERGADDGMSKHKLITFDSTPKMSSYLLGFCIGNFEYVEHFYLDDEFSLPIRIYTLPDQSNNVDLALKLAITAFKKCNDVFKIKYPIDKLDLIALPEYGSCAFEAFGLIMFKDYDLFDCDASPA